MIVNSSYNNRWENIERNVMNMPGREKAPKKKKGYNLGSILFILGLLAIVGAFLVFVVWIVSEFLGTVDKLSTYGLFNGQPGNVVIQLAQYAKAAIPLMMA